MEVLYCLSEKDANNEYKEYGIFNSFESALITIYDNGLYKFKNLMKEIGAHRSEEYLENNCKYFYNTEKKTLEIF